MEIIYCSCIPIYGGGWDICRGTLKKIIILFVRVENGYTVQNPKAAMMDEDGFKEMIECIQKLGYDEETAADYACRIGDTPTVDEAGNTLVLDDRGQIVARLNLSWRTL